MRFWTYKEASDKVITDLDLQDQIFVTASEMIGYFNEGVKDASSEILKINEDYFLKRYYVPLVQGVDTYEYPYDIYAIKIRGLQYSNGTIIYPVTRIRDKDKFDVIANQLHYSAADDYCYYTLNEEVNQQKIIFIPAARETAIVPPNTGPFTPLTMWYIRNSKRIPILGEFIPQYEQILPSAVDISANTLTLTNSYVTGDQVKLTAVTSVPGALTSSTIYYIISTGSGLYKLATSLVNARLGTAIDLTSQGSGIITIQIAANQTIINNTLIDIPQFIEFVMQWAKCRCLEKEGDPRLAGATVTLERLRKQMVDSLTQAVPDNDDTIQGDFSIYQDMMSAGMWGGY